METLVCLYAHHSAVMWTFILGFPWRWTWQNFTADWAASHEDLLPPSPNLYTTCYLLHACMHHTHTPPISLSLTPQRCQTPLQVHRQYACNMKVISDRPGTGKNSSRVASRPAFKSYQEILVNTFLVEKSIIIPPSSSKYIVVVYRHRHNVPFIHPGQSTLCSISVFASSLSLSI